MIKRMNQYFKAKEAFDQSDYEVSGKFLDEILLNDSTNVDALLLRSSIAQKRNDWAKALNDLNRILDIDEMHEQALNLKEMIVNILKFRNTDLYNP